MKNNPKWRELLNSPEDIKYNNMILKEIISYLPAGNDVIEGIFLKDNKEVNLFVKIERSTRADFATEIKHLKILSDNKYFTKIPSLVEDGLINEKVYMVLEKVSGQRLSEILKESTKDKNILLKEYGKELAIIHKIPKEKFKESYQRPVNDIPVPKKYNQLEDDKLLKYYNFLKDNKPEIKSDTFIHGDFHYGNVLFTDNKVCGVLDWEYSGQGFKEQDIAWALTLRNTQKFMDTIEDLKDFLEGYKEEGTYSSSKLKWCLINAYLHFYIMFRNDSEYTSKILRLIEQVYELEEI